MKFTRQISLVCATVLLLSLVASAQNSQPTSLPVGSATVAEFKGDVTLHAPDGTVLAADRGLTLAPESVIDTGKGSTLLDLADGSQLLVKPHSHVILKAPDQGLGYSLQLTIGKILAQIRKRLGDTPSFRMGTPTAVITVRGTRFEVEVDKKQRTRVEVYEGIVEVARLQAGTGAVLIRPGFFTSVQFDRDPENPRQVSQGEDISGGGEDRVGSPRPGVGGEGQPRGTAPSTERPESDH
jgi:ferric-dicitrate binding protein FerR (iron transport regulator)